jgi:hypothetical protein
MRGAFMTAAVVAGSLFAAAQTPPVIFTTPLSPRIANYQIQVKLDPKTHRLAGHERVVWRNTTADVVSDARFHLYLNAFANNRSVFMRESGGQLRGISYDEESWGYCQVTSIAS